VTSSESATSRENAALPSGLEITTDPARIDFTVVYDFISHSYWGEGRARETVERSIRNSLCFSAHCDQKQVAFARVISDYATFAYLADVFVVPEFRGRGVSKALMRAIQAHSQLQNIRVFMLRTRDAHGLYAQFGFKPLTKPEWVMENFNPNPGEAAR
jgi:N-acetylglutamate synthase-like GNAT family acetyltransferase